MKVVLTAVPIVTFQPDLIGGVPSPEHLKWGWCPLVEAVRIINAHYGFDWKPKRFLFLFAHREKIYGRLPVTLISLNAPENVFHYASMSQETLDDESARWCVPAGWMKGVLFSIGRGAVMYAIQRPSEGIKELWAINDLGEQIMTAP